MFPFVEKTRIESKVCPFTWCIVVMGILNVEKDFLKCWLTVSASVDFSKYFDFRLRRLKSTSWLRPNLLLKTAE